MGCRFGPKRPVGFNRNRLPLSAEIACRKLRNLQACDAGSIGASGGSARRTRSRQRDPAIGGLGARRMPGPIAMAGLIEALGCESKQVSIRANRSLGRIDDESV